MANCICISGFTPGEGERETYEWLHEMAAEKLGMEWAETVRFEVLDGKAYITVPAGKTHDIDEATHNLRGGQRMEYKSRELKACKEQARAGQEQYTEGGSISWEKIGL